MCVWERGWVCASVCAFGTSLEPREDHGLDEAGYLAGGRAHGEHQAGISLARVKLQE